MLYLQQIYRKLTIFLLKQLYFGFTECKDSPLNDFTCFTERNNKEQETLQRTFEEKRALFTSTDIFGVDSSFAVSSKI